MIKETVNKFWFHALMTLYFKIFLYDKITHSNENFNAGVYFNEFDCNNEILSKYGSVIYAGLNESSRRRTDIWRAFYKSNLMNAIFADHFI